MMHLTKPLTVALRGKGWVALFKRVWNIARRYGLTAARMDCSLAQFSRILRQFDCQATLPITAVALARNGAIIQKHQAQGTEFAVHGYRHVDYSRMSLSEQYAHFRKAGQVFRDHSVRFEGFRSPYLRWNAGTLAALSQNSLSYDSSSSLYWDVGAEHVTDSYRRVLGFYGAQPAADYPAVPYLDTAMDLVRIPYCLPDDEALVERLRWRSSAEMNQVWPTIFHQVHRRGELFTLGLHPERIKGCADALIATLQEARTATPAVWCARLSEIAAWWKARYVAVVDATDIGDHCLQLTVNGPAGTTLLLRALDVQTGTKPWCDGYQLASEMPAIVRVTKRPFIGVSPDSAPALLGFLKQQGYIVEISTQPDSYSLYLNHRSFLCHEEEPLLAQIEAVAVPLAQLGRWPNGARSALAITGDIDALTLWDYGLRLCGAQ
jgi:peptidoglycan/xylan/chitin deacetylase (PgdA/CDA1 family)